jgi:uncharacterized protein YndB with AHSA1/START domain
MEYGTIEKSIYIDAAPDTVYDVVSRPEHLANWYVDEAAFASAPHSSGRLAFGGPDRRVEVPITVVEATPGVRFSFRWTAPPSPALLPVGATLTEANSVLVTFELTAQGKGTLLTVTEAGMRELGWEAAKVEQYCDGHNEGWIELLARLESYVGKLTMD